MNSCQKCKKQTDLPLIEFQHSKSNVWEEWCGQCYREKHGLEKPEPQGLDEFFTED